MKTMLPVAAVAMVASTTMASAENSFASTWLLPEEAQVVLSLVKADADGVVEVYDYRTGAMGTLLGTMAVVPGDNPWLRIDIEPTQYHDVVAVMRIGDAIAVQEVVAFHSRGR